MVATDDTIMPMLSKGKTANARMWVYVGDDGYPYNVFDFTLNRGRDGPRYFLKDYRLVLLADAYGGYNGVVAGNEITRAGCWAHMKRKVIDAEKSAPEIAKEAVERVRALYAVERQAQNSTEHLPNWETKPDWHKYACQEGGWIGSSGWQPGLPITFWDCAFSWRVAASAEESAHTSKTDR